MKTGILAAFVAAFSFAALAHDHSTPAGQFYQRWKQPLNRDADGQRTQSCCSDYDCEQTQIVRKDGKWYARDHKMARGRDVLIPDDKLESNQADPRESPDGRSHVCLNAGNVLCAVLGSEN